jgi:hypothetical protein
MIMIGRFVHDVFLDVIGIIFHSLHLLILSLQDGATRLKHLYQQSWLAKMIGLPDNLIETPQMRDFNGRAGRHSCLAPPDGRRHS